MDLGSLLEKIAIGVGTGIISGAGGYVVATVRFEKKLPDLIAAAASQLETKIIAMVGTSLQAHAQAFETEKKTLAKEHDSFKMRVSKDLAELEGKIERVDRESSQEMRTYTREAGHRWTVVERTLGQIEGRLSSTPPSKIR